jgi:hypothetical protein
MPAADAEQARIGQLEHEVAELRAALAMNPGDGPVKAMSRRVSTRTEGRKAVVPGRPVLHRRT